MRFRITGILISQRLIDHGYLGAQQVLAFGSGRFISVPFLVETNQSIQLVIVGDGSCVVCIQIDGILVGVQVVSFYVIWIGMGGGGIGPVGFNPPQGRHYGLVSIIIGFVRDIAFDIPSFQGSECGRYGHEDGLILCFVGRTIIHKGKDIVCIHFSNR